MTERVSRRTLSTGLALAGAGLMLPFVSRHAAAAPITLVLSHHLPTAHLVHRTSERFATLVGDATKGQVTVEVHPNAQLFNLRSGAEALRLGTLDLAWTDFGTLGNWRPEFGFISLPFLLAGFDQAKKVLYGPVGEQVRTDVLKTLGIDILALGASGFRVFLGNKPIRTADDCKGIKLRVPEVPIYVAMARALDANPTPIPADGIYTSLQTHVVDMIEIPPDFIADTKMWEVGRDSSRTNHIFTDVSLMSSGTRMRSLPPDVQKALRDAAYQAVQIEMWNANLANQESAWAATAAHTKAIADPDRKSFREKTRSVTEDFIVKNPAAKPYVAGVAATA